MYVCDYGMDNDGIGEGFWVKREGVMGAGEVKVKVRGVHLFLMVFEDDKERNECASILFYN